jgi:hypothetical protein
MTDREGKEKTCPCRVLLSASFDCKQRAIREMVLAKHGHCESVLELGGKVVGPDIIVTEGLIPKAVIGYAYFRVEDRDLSACWAQADKDLSPVGDLHYHPEIGFDGHGPSPSSTDEENARRISGLYHVFNLRSSQERKVLEKSTRVQAKDGHHYYDIDPFSSVSIPVQEEGAPGEPPVLIRREKRSLWASLIVPRDGDLSRLTANVLEHVYSSRYPEEPAVLVHEKVPAEVLSDDEIAQLTGWPVEKIRLVIDPEELEKEVAEKYRTGGYGEYRSGYDEYGHGHGYWDSGSNYGYGYLKKSWEKGYRNRPAWYGLPWGQKTQGPLYLDSRSGSAEVARVLREVASRVAGKPLGRDEKFSFLRKDAGKDEVLKALQECYWFLKYQPEKGARDAN